MVISPPAHVSTTKTLPPRSLLISCNKARSCCLSDVFPLSTYPCLARMRRPLHHLAGGAARHATARRSTGALCQPRDQRRNRRSQSELQTSGHLHGKSAAHSGPLNHHFTPRMAVTTTQLVPVRVRQRH